VEHPHAALRRLAGWWRRRCPVSESLLKAVFRPLSREVWARSTEAEVEAKSKWLAGLLAAIGAVGTAVNGLEWVEPAGAGRVWYGIAALFLTLAVALLAAGWLLPSTTPDENTLSPKASVSRVGLVFGLLGLLCAGFTPLASYIWPSSSILQEARLALGYEFVRVPRADGHQPDTLRVSAAGLVAPRSSLRLMVLTASGAAACADLGDDRPFASWGIAVPGDGGVAFTGSTVAPEDSVGTLCLRAVRHAGDGGAEDSTHLLIRGGIGGRREP
jgi:hypothetical protein